MRALPTNDEIEGLGKDGVDISSLRVTAGISGKSKPVVKQASEPSPVKPANKSMPTVVDGGRRKDEKRKVAKVVPASPVPPSGNNGPSFPLLAAILIVIVVLLVVISGK